MNAFLATLTRPARSRQREPEVPGSPGADHIPTSRDATGWTSPRPPGVVDALSREGSEQARAAHVLRETAKRPWRAGRRSNMWPQLMGAVLLALLSATGMASPRETLAAESLSQAIEHVPGPAQQYSLLPSDIGPGFRELSRHESEDGRNFSSRFVAPDAQVVNQAIHSPSDIVVSHTITIEQHGSDAEVLLKFNTVLDALRSKSPTNVQPAEGWGSEQVYSLAQGRSGWMHRGILLRHRNAVAYVDITGLEQYATWDRIAGLMRIVERRLHAAVQ
jgi:hypothetical protein